MAMINRLVIFPPITEDEWGFRCSITNNKNIMIIAWKIIDPAVFRIRFFVDTEKAILWKDLCISDSE
jgi:hypothetical protein